MTRCRVIGVRCFLLFLFTDWLVGCLIDWLAFNHSFDKDNIDI